MCVAAAAVIVVAVGVAGVSREIKWASGRRRVPDVRLVARAVSHRPFRASQFNPPRRLHHLNERRSLEGKG